MNLSGKITFAILLYVISAIPLYAHNPNVTAFRIERQQTKWILVVEISYANILASHMPECQNVDVGQCLTQHLQQTVSITANGAVPIRLTSPTVKLDPHTSEVRFNLESVPPDLRTFHIDIRSFTAFNVNQTNMVTVQDAAAEVSHVLTPTETSFDVEFTSRGLAEMSPGKAKFKRVTDWVLLGTTHVISGWDHVLFIAALALTGTSLVRMFWVVSAFTVAHSLTLAYAVYGSWSPGSAFVEPLIAFSIAWVGLAGYLFSDRPARWLIAFGFGLVHGFGFADGFKALNLPKSELLTSLISFNCGVELAQMLVLGVIFAWLYGNKKWNWIAPAKIRWFNMAIGIVGLVVALARIKSAFL